MIQFSNPAALWLLTLLAPLILLYLLKRKRRDLTVPSLLLWKQALEDTRAHRPFQKLRSQLLLYLQILAIVLITAILSGPHILEQSQQSRRWVAILDVSASMQATDVSPNRFEAARAQLSSALERASPADEIMLITVGADVSIVQQFTTQHAALRRKLQDLQPEDTSGNWARLGTVLEPLVKEQQPPRIVIASDFAGFPETLEKKIPFDALTAGSTQDNMAITRVVTEPLPEDPAKQQLFYQIRNYAPTPKDLDVVLKVDERVVDAFHVLIQPASGLDKSAELEVRQTATVTLSIEPADALLLDNTFALVVHPHSRMLVEPQMENVFLAKALAALPSISVAEKAPVVIAKTEMEVPASPGIYFAAGDAAGNSGRILQWNAAHPALRFVDAGLWMLSKSRIVSPPPDASVLMEIGSGPVAYARETASGRVVVLGFTLENSNLYQLAGFPVFLQNALLWIREGMEKPLSSRTGPGATKEGAYQTDGVSGFRNFADPSESQIQPRRPSGLSSSSTRNLPRRRDLAQWFLIITLGIVMLEWWAFHRRVGS